MSNKRLRGAQALIAQMGETIPDAEKQANRQAAAKPVEKEPPASKPSKKEELDRLNKEKLSTTVSLSTKLAITKIQEDAIGRGWKKPKIGEILDESVLLLLQERGLSLD